MAGVFGAHQTDEPNPLGIVAVAQDAPTPAIQTRKGSEAMSTWGTPIQEQAVSVEDNQLLENWYNAQKQLSEVKATEMELRKQCVARFFNEDDREGTARFPLPEGFKLKVVKKQNYKLKNDNGELDRVLENVSEDVAAILVKWTPTLSVSNFKRLTPDVQAVFNPCLEITDASPTLEIEAPKA